MCKGIARRILHYLYVLILLLFIHYLIITVFYTMRLQSYIIIFLPLGQRLHSRIRAGKFGFENKSVEPD